MMEWLDMTVVVGCVILVGELLDGEEVTAEDVEEEELLHVWRG